MPPILHNYSTEDATYLYTLAATDLRIHGDLTLPSGRVLPGSDADRLVLSVRYDPHPVPADM